MPIQCPISCQEVDRPSPTEYDRAGPSFHEGIVRRVQLNQDPIGFAGDNICVAAAAGRAV